LDQSDRRPGRAQREPGPITTGGDHGSPLSRGRHRWPKWSWLRFAKMPLALMLRSLAAEPERRRFHGPSPLRCVSKHEGPPSSSFETRATLTRLCGSACACALLRMRTAEVAARRRTVFGNSRLTMSNSHSRSRGAFLRPGFCILCFTDPESRGGRSAEKRSGAQRNTRGAYHVRQRRA
jgi:hypothetical protein